MYVARTRLRVFRVSICIMTAGAKIISIQLAESGFAPRYGER